MGAKRKNEEIILKMYHNDFDEMTYRNQKQSLQIFSISPISYETSVTSDFVQISHIKFKLQFFTDIYIKYIYFYRMLTL